MVDKHVSFARLCFSVNTPPLYRTPFNWQSPTLCTARPLVLLQVPFLGHTKIKNLLCVWSPVYIQSFIVYWAKFKRREGAGNNILSCDSQKHRYHSFKSPVTSAYYWTPLCAGIPPVKLMPQPHLPCHKGSPSKRHRFLNRGCYSTGRHYTGGTVLHIWKKFSCHLFMCNITATRSHTNTKKNASEVIFSDNTTGSFDDHCCFPREMKDIPAVWYLQKYTHKTMLK